MIPCIASLNVNPETYLTLKPDTKNYYLCRLKTTNGDG
jgi:hypothetical protein